MADQRNTSIASGDADGMFDWRDPFLLEQALNDEERAVRDTVARYAREKLQPRVVAAFREEHTDRAIFRELQTALA